MTLNNRAHKSKNQNNERLQLKKENFRALSVALKVNFSSVIPSDCLSVWVIEKHYNNYTTDNEYLNRGWHGCHVSTQTQTKNTFQYSIFLFVSKSFSESNLFKIEFWWISEIWDILASK